ncbi:MAG: MBOAT family protein [Oscillospiraceae bacterium]|nr:MBOAT family protein [Oscillospiraceae bacterium]
MVFSDPVFLFFFLPAVILVTKLSPRPLRNAALLLFSLLFYAWGEPVYVFLMLAVIVLNYLAGLRLRCFPADTAPGRRRLVLILAVAADLAILGFFKYSGFFTELLNTAAGLHLPVPQIVLPIGISFYIFQSMSYVIDVYRGDADAQRNILSFGTYVALFPQLIAGPIVRYRDIALQLTGREETVSLFASGAVKFIYGLAKKVLLANQMGLLADRMLLREGGTLSAWVGMAAYTLQIYFDFSGYSDMAIGLGRMFGFRFLKNFDYPYISQSITEFWRRWHMSLSSWFREYVYIPLGGNRRGLFRQCLNLLIVWLLTGLWHGASMNFVLWGLYYAVLLILEKLLFGRLLLHLPAFFRHLVTLLIVAFGWGIFYYTDMDQWLVFLRRLFLWSADSGDALRFMLAYIPIFYVSCFAATRRPIRAILRLRAGAFAFLEILWLVLLFVLCTAALVSQGYNPFIYFRF